MDLLLTNLMLVFVLAVVIGVIFKYIGLPSIIGQVIVGLGIGMSGLLNAESIEMMHVLGSVGITLLLFLVGLEMNWREIKKVGSKVLFIFLSQSLTLFLIFIALAVFLLKLDFLSAFMLSVSLSLSSTIVVVKVLSEKKDLSSFTGKLSLGILLLQDILAIVLLVFLPSLGRSINFQDLGFLLIKLVSIVLIVNVIGHTIITKILQLVIKSGEDLILFSLAWFMVVVFMSVKFFGLSSEVGAFLAGLSLSTSWGHFQIINKVKTLRDIFLTLFFVLLGLQIGDGNLNWTLVGVLFVLIVLSKFFVTYFWSKIFGLTNRVSFLISLNMTQLSEFSLVVMGIGLTLGYWNNDLVKIITVVGLLSMSFSSVAINIGNDIYKVFVKRFSWLYDTKDVKNEATSLHKHIVLIGGDRTGKGIMDHLIRRREKILVVDFNPDVVRKINNRGVEAIFADAADPDIFELANLKEAKMIISTVKDVNDSLTLLEEVKKRGLVIPVIVDAENIDEAKLLYKAGATYVLFPHFVSGWHMNQLLIKHKTDKNTFKKYKEKQDKLLRAIYGSEY